MTHQQPINGMTAHRATRWPDYAVTGAGSRAVVFECCRRVLLVQTPLEAQALAAEKCCGTCSHAAAPGAGLHSIHTLNEPRHEPQRRSMRRLPGWGDDD